MADGQLRQGFLALTMMAIMIANSAVMLEKSILVMNVEIPTQTLRISIEQSVAMVVQSTIDYVAFKGPLYWCTHRTVNDGYG